MIEILGWVGGVAAVLGVLALIGVGVIVSLGLLGFLVVMFVDTFTNFALSDRLENIQWGTPRAMLMRRKENKVAQQRLELKRTLAREKVASYDYRVARAKERRQELKSWQRQFDQADGVDVQAVDVRDERQAMRDYLSGQTVLNYRYLEPMINLQGQRKHNIFEES